MTDLTSRQRGRPTTTKNVNVQGMTKTWSWFPKWILPKDGWLAVNRNVTWLLSTQSWGWRKYVSPKRWYMPTKLNGDKALNNINATYSLNASSDAEKSEMSPEKNLIGTWQNTSLFNFKKQGEYRESFLSWQRCDSQKANVLSLVQGQVLPSDVPRTQPQNSRLQSLK